MKIVYFIDHLRPDGAQRALAQIVAGLAERRHQQAVVCLNDSADASVVAALRSARAEVRVVGRTALASGAGLAALWLWLRQRRFDCAVTMLLYADVIGRPLARAAGVRRVIGSIRSTNVQYSGAQRALVRATARCADVFVLNSEHARAFAAEAEGARPARALVIPNGVCLGQRTAARDELRAELGLPDGARLIGSVGRLSAEKGHSMLLDALALLPRSDAHLLLAGTGPEESALRRQALRLGVAGRTHFAGHRRDVPRLLGALDVFVHPSRWEGMSNAVLEAMAAGCPIVASAIPGNRELIEDGVHGWLVPPEDAQALGAALGAALADPAEARRRGDAAMRRAAARYSVATMVDAWERVVTGSVGA